MNRTELYYREARHESFPPRHRTNQPQPSGSLNEGTEQRILSLYTSGQSIESITREVGRARHLIVHLLQSRGVFGNRRTEPAREESVVELGAVEERRKEFVIEERKLDPVAGEESEPEIATEKPSRKMTRLRRSKVVEQSKPIAIEKPKADQFATQEGPNRGRWSPLVVEALLKVAAQSEIDWGMSLQEVKKLSAGSMRKAGRKG